MRNTSHPVIRHAALLAAEQLEQRTLLSTSFHDGCWTIQGDPNPLAPNDHITIDLSPNDPSKLRALINNKSTYINKSDLRSIRVLAGNGDDSVTLTLPAKLNIAVSVFGGNGNDTITGSNLNDFLVGDDGNDSISGNAGNDSLFGSAGRDTLLGGDGNDLLLGGKAGDLLLGNDGNDSLRGQAGHDSLAGGLHDDQLLGGLGKDHLHGGYGADSLLGQSGTDSLFGGDGKDSLLGGPGHDKIHFVPREDYIQKSSTDTRLIEQRIKPLAQLNDPDDLKSWLIDNAVQQWKFRLGQPVYYWWWSRGGDLLLQDSHAAVKLSNASPASESNDHSNTNTQVQGVDEADLVKTDGSYLYILQNNELVILDAWPAQQTHILSRTPIQGYPQGIYLHGDSVAVISAVYNTDGSNWFGRAGKLASLCPYPWRYNAQTQLTVFNVANRHQPTPILQTTLDGTSSQSRMIDGRLYLILNNSLDLIEPDRIEIAPSDPDSPLRSNWVYESEESYRARLQALPLEQLLPGYSSTLTSPDGSTSSSSGSIPRLPHFYVPADSSDYSYNMLSISLFDLNNLRPDPLATTSVVGIDGTIYASTQNLYLANTTWEAPARYWTGELRTDLYKFALNPDSVPLLATGEVAGHVHNQFSIDENNGFLRIATTSSTSDASSNNVFVLADSDNGLTTVGSITGLGFSEQIYAARFVGDRGYLVTFRQIDPLFTLDLSNPLSPIVAGELKIPGYSAYLHPIDDNLLIGVGRDADSSGRVKGVQVSLFDVSNISNPTRLGTYNFPKTGNSDWSTWSAAEWDHHAFSYFPQQHILALPLVAYGFDWSDSYGLNILKINPDADPNHVFTLLGTIQHNQPVERSLRINNFLYSIGSDAIHVVNLDQPDQILATILMPQDSYSDPYPVALD